MTLIETAKVTSKGQVTIPNRVRKLLHVSSGDSLAFGLSKEGITILPCKVTVESIYSASEWEKIERLACAKGKVYKNVKRAKKHIEGYAKLETLAAKEKGKEKHVTKRFIDNLKKGRV